MSSQPVDHVNVVPLISLSTAGHAYTYRVPEFLDGSVSPGVLVRAPFRQRPVLGVVLGTADSANRTNILDLIAVEDPKPVLLPHLLDLAQWMSREYVAPLADVLSVMLPSALKRLRARPQRGPLQVAITDAGRAVLQDPDGLGRAPAQRRILELLGAADGAVPVSDLQERALSKRSSIKALESSGLVAISIVAASTVDTPVDIANGTVEALRLSNAQAGAVAAIVHATKASAVATASAPASKVFLLHGVTGSGKTEVYMSVIEEVLRQGRSAVVLVPEISLTPQAIQRFTRRFPGIVASLNSRMAEGERRREWERLRLGAAKIAIGPRSALFAPLSNLGIIILDEEHDSSYKQEESPRYHARETAIHLGRSLNVPIVLGSATPDVSSYYAARKGAHTLLSLPERPVWDVTDRGIDSVSTIKRSTPADRDSQAAARPMPTVQLVDLRQELRAGNRGIFSRALRTALIETYSTGCQALLLLNRRGAATSVVCRECGFVAVCRSCDVPLTFHSTGRRLICHRCDRHYPPPALCPQCSSEKIRYLGVGTQRVADEVVNVIPNARVVRWDRDVTGAKQAHEQIARSFAQHEADVLVGTQMVAKGHDFPLVTLVGVIVADIGLNLPDFRAAERTFQLMTQVAGRAGRADLDSRVIIQAYNPDHYALQTSKRHDYWAFYSQEMTFRLAAGYPPYSRLARCLIRGKDDAAVAKRAHALRERIQKQIEMLKGMDAEVIGPAPAFAAKINDVFHWHLLVRAREIHALLDVVPDDVTVDVDPVDLL